MALARVDPPPDVLYGHARPRIAPPLPLRHDLAGYRETAATLDIEPMPWQDTAAMYATALDKDDRYLYREFAAVVARQNGKTTFTKPIVVRRLLAGRRIMHIAQVRELPRIMFEAIADAIEASEPGLLPTRRGKTIWPRRGAGSESIVLNNGGEYRIASAITGGRGFSFDDLLIDELREMDSFDVVNAAKPAQRFSENPQTIYLSNMGTDHSVILNSLTDRAGDDPSLAYLEWSADPEYDTGDIRGWLQANPSVGHYPQVLRDLQQDYRAAKLAGNLAGFETEALCRRVPTLRERLVDAYSWTRCADPDLEAPRQPVMAVSMSPDGKRASVALAWQGPTSVGLRLLYNVPGDPIDIPALGEDIRRDVAKYGVRRIGFDPLTDAELVKYVKNGESITGRLFANASAQFVNIVNAGKLRWQDCDAVTDDLTWTARKAHDDTGHFEAVRATDDRSITAALAAIRAVWLASGPKPPAAKVM